MNTFVQPCFFNRAHTALAGGTIVNRMAEFSGGITEISFKALIDKKKAVFEVLDGNVAGQKIDNLIQIFSGNAGQPAGIAFGRVCLICHDRI